MKALELDINKLPSKAKKELLEYYSFLMYKYSTEIENEGKKKSERKKTNVFDPFLNDTISIANFTTPIRDERNEK
jgi:hypothetical protein